MTYTYTSLTPTPAEIIVSMLAAAAVWWYYTSLVTELFQALALALYIQAPTSTDCNFQVY